jgi:ribose/xylose/arabinose/galactoside ABC-type transport system permease subunit
MNDREKASMRATHMIESTDPIKRAELSSAKSATAKFLARFGPLPFLIVPSIVIFAWGNPRFLSEANVVNMLQQGVYLLLAAIAQLLVLIAGGFDLSVGSNIALTSIVSSSLMVAVQQAFPDAGWLAVLAGLLATLGVGVFAGICNAAGVALLKVNPFIVTLATASIFQGLTLLISQGLQIEGLPDPFVEVLGAGFVWQIPVPALIAIPIVLFFYVLTSWTRFGRNLYATGANPRAALIVGISVPWVLFVTYLCCAVLAAITGFLLTARVSSGEPLLGAEFPLRSITAAVIGGCSLRGGKGTVVGVVLGVVFVTILANGMDLLRLGSNFQMIILGVVLIGAVVLDRYRAA